MKPLILLAFLVSILIRPAAARQIAPIDTPSVGNKGPIMVLTLTDGRIVRGTVVETVPGKGLRIRTPDGVIHSYRWGVVSKISREPLIEAGTPEGAGAQPAVQQAPPGGQAVPPPRVRRGRSRRGFVVSGGVASLSYTTNWYYHKFYYNILDEPSYYYYYPKHVFARTAFVFSAEYQSLIVLGPVQVDLALDGNYGITSGTNADWIAATNQVSSGGNTMGATFGPRVCVPLRASQDWTVTPFVGPAFHFEQLDSDGKGLQSSLSNIASYYNGSAWSESVMGLAIDAGVKVEIDRIVITPVVRYLVSIGATSTWKPSGYSVTDEGPSGMVVLATVGWRF